MPTPRRQCSTCSAGSRRQHRRRGSNTADGDRVVDRVIVRGTHQGELMGIPPSGQRIEMEEIHIARIVDGKMVERWTQFDMFGLQQQIGGIPGPPATA